MAVAYSPFGRCLRRAVLTASLLALASVAQPAFAASGRAFVNAGTSAGQAAPSPDYCRTRHEHRRLWSDSNCPDDQSYTPPGNDTARHPAPSAFGLQFNSADD